MIGKRKVVTQELRREAHGRLTVWWASCVGCEKDLGGAKTQTKAKMLVAAHCSQEHGGEVLLRVRQTTVPAGRRR